MTIKGTKMPHRMWSKSVTKIDHGHVLVARPSTCKQALKVTADPFHQMLIKYAMEHGEIRRR